MGKVSKVGQKRIGEVLQMVSRAFKYPEGELISRDFPLFFSNQNADHLFAVFESTEAGTSLASHAGTYAKRLISGSCEMQVGGIGGVATDERFQGKGYGKSVIEACLKDLKKSDCKLAFLWTGEHDFFRRFGFELVGAQWSITAPNGESQAVDKFVTETDTIPDSGVYNQLEVLEGARHIYKEGLSLYNSHELRLTRNQEEFETLVSSAGCRVFSAHKDGRLLAYALLGKGIDLPMHIHEWAGAEVGLMKILSTIQSIEDSPITILAPQFTPEECNWIYSLEKIGFKCSLGYMAMVKILDFEFIHALINSRARELSMDPSFLRMEDMEDGTYTIGWATDPDIRLTESEFLQFLFGPRLPSEQIPLTEDGAAAFDSLLPLRLWWWGMDSV